MNIQSINAGVNVYSSKEKTELNKRYPEDKNKAGVAKNKSDSFTISPEAQKFMPIMSNIKNGVYNSPEIMKKVAERLNTEFPKD